MYILHVYLNAYLHCNILFIKPSLTLDYKVYVDFNFCAA